MHDLHLRFNGPIPKHLQTIYRQDVQRSDKRLCSEILAAKIYKKLLLKKRIPPYPSQRDEPSQHNK